MAWLNLVHIIILLFSWVRAKTLGFVLATFDLIQLIISFKLTKKYYYTIYSFLLNNAKIYLIFNSLVIFILKFIFIDLASFNLNFISRLVKNGIIELVILFFSLSLLYKFINILLNIIFSIFSFLLDIKIKRKIDRFLGGLIGLFKGLLLIYILNNIILLLYKQNFIKLVPSSIFNFIR